jgi:NOL1/NOP2/fmu family ribosome biogenesis protein
VKPGGRLVYSTCTFSEEENEQTVNWFLESFPNFELVPVSGIGHYGTEELKSFASVRRIYPMDGGEGQFLACFRNTDCESSCTELPLLKSDPIPSVAVKFLKESLQGSFPYLFARNGQVYGGTFPFIDCGRNRLIRHQCFLGTVKSGRFEPSHALAMNAWARFGKTAELTKEEAEAYRRGETIPRKCEKGWIAVTVNGDIIGLSKSDGMMLKNHYPKSFRKR